MKFGSVCSGIEAASVAFEPLGWKAAWFSEIEPFPCAVLKHHYPDTPNHGDMTTLPERIRSGEVEAPDLFCGGTPCQAFSVAGLRQSLADDRGNLSLTFCEIANAIDDVRLGRGESPAIIFWENVPGVLSTQDNAFGCFLGALSGCDTPISPGRLGWTDAGVVAGPQRTVSWRVLDAQYFGLAQRRRRVFVVASARDGFDPAEVLLEWQGVRRDSAPSREAGQRPTGSIVARTGRNGGGSNHHVIGANENATAAVAFGFDGDVMKDGLMETMTTREGAISDTAHAVMQPVSIQGNLIGRSAGGPQGVGASQDGVMYTLTKMDVHGVAQPVTYDLFNVTAPVNRQNRQPGDPYHTLARANAEHAVVVGVQPIALQDVRGVEKAQNGRGWNDDGTAYTIDTHATQGVCQPIAWDEELNASVDQAGTLLRGGQGGRHDGVAVQPIPIDSMNHIGRGDKHSFGDFQPGAPSYTLTKGYSHAVAMAMQVRRLTPVECERLQGFPDGYTAIPWRGKPTEECPDGPRYKALGNSWAVPCVQWIGRRIQQEAQGKVPS